MVFSQIPYTRGRSATAAALPARDARQHPLGAELARILVEVGEPAPSLKILSATAGGDGRRLRSIPAHAKGNGGRAISGTEPVQALLAKERRNGRRRS